MCGAFYEKRSCVGGGFGKVGGFFIGHKIVFTVAVVLFVTDTVCFMYCASSRGVVVRTSMSRCGGDRCGRLVVGGSCLSATYGTALTMVSVTTSSLLASIFVRGESGGGLVGSIIMRSFLASRCFIGGLSSSRFGGLLISLRGGGCFANGGVGTCVCTTVEGGLGATPLSSGPLCCRGYACSVGYESCSSCVRGRFLGSVRMGYVSEYFGRGRFVLLSIAGYPVSNLRASRVGDFGVSGGPVSLGLVGGTPFGMSSVDVGRKCDRNFGCYCSNVVSFSNARGVAVSMRCVAHAPGSSTACAMELPCPYGSFGFGFSLSDGGCGVGPVTFKFVSSTGSSPGESGSEGGMAVGFRS